MSARWDIFCKVVDNYGDIGVAWRLSRQLAKEHGLAVRLWVDDVGAFAKLRPEARTDAALQLIDGVDVRRWTDPFPEVEPGDVVIETFQCAAPDSLVAAMAASGRRIAWINLDYLTAEDWVGDCHARPSPHPRLPLTRHFFFPGFDSRTGGLLLERGRVDDRERFLAAPGAQASFWKRLGAPPPSPGERRVSLFCYESAPIGTLLAAMAVGTENVGLIVPEGQADEAVNAFLTGQSGDRLRVLRVPWMSQDDYDRLLWSCDINFVRGEDSFVRAQWAERPFVWQAYPQEATAHWIKINAFLDRYTEGLQPAAADALRDLARGWNGMVRPEALASGWNRFLAQREALTRHGADWAGRLRGLGDLAGNLVRFCKGLI